VLTRLFLAELAAVDCRPPLIEAPVILTHQMNLPALHITRQNEQVNVRVRRVLMDAGDGPRVGEILPQILAGERRRVRRFNAALKGQLDAVEGPHPPARIRPRAPPLILLSLPAILRDTVA